MQQERVDATPELGVVPALSIERGLALLGRQLQRIREQLLQSLPTIRAHRTTVLERSYTSSYTVAFDRADHE